MKKRSEFEAYLKDLAENKEIVANSGSFTIPAYLFSTQRLEKGVSVMDIYCQKCGAKYTQNYSMPTKCKCCGNGNMSYQLVYSFNKKKCVYARETQSGFEFFRFLVDFNATNGTPATENTANIEIQYVGLFDRENGYFVYDALNGKLIRNGMALKKVINETFSMRNQTVPANFVDLKREADEYEKRRAKKAEDHKKLSKAGMIEAMHSKYTAAPLTKEQIDKIDFCFAKKYSTLQNGNTSFLVMCSKSNKAQEIETNYTQYGAQEIQCPICGKKIISRNILSEYSRATKNFTVFENTPLPENDLLMRAFDMEISVDDDLNIEKSVHERTRIFAGKTLRVYDGKGAKLTIRDIYDRTIYENGRPLIQDDDEIAGIIKNSCLAQSGLIECYGLGDQRYKMYESAPQTTYLRAWYKNHAVELILKANMTHLLRDIIYESGENNLQEGRTVAEVLNVPPAVARAATKEDFNKHDLRQYHLLYDNDNTLTFPVYKRIVEELWQVDKVAEIKRRFNICYTKQLDYIQSVYNHQCIAKNEALNIWRDYLNLAHDLKIDMTDKNRVFPTSLKKEHDVAVFAYRAVKVELDKQRFASQAKDNERYEYTYEDLIAIVPKTPQDIVEEATRQHNCLRSYVSSVTNGQSIIVFIRHKDEPDKSFVTAEIQNNTLVQLKAAFNANVKDKNVHEFVSHWSKAKRLTVRC